MHDKQFPNINISVIMGELVPERQPEALKKESVEEKIQGCLHDLEADVDSKEAWNYLRKLNNYLIKKKKLTPKQKSVMKLIDPAIKKYGYMDHRGVEQDPELEY